MKIKYWSHKAWVKIHTHSSRHKFATDIFILEHGGNIRAVQELPGHANLGTTETYLSVTNENLKNTVNLLVPHEQESAVTADEVEASEEKNSKDTRKLAEKSNEASESVAENKLHLRVREIQLIGFKSNVYLVLLRLTFLNQTSVGITVYHLGSGAPNSKMVSNPISEYHKNRQKVRIYLSTNERVKADVKTEELLLMPLDIPSHESKSLWMPLEIHRTETDTNNSIGLVIIASDISGKTLAEFNEPVELRTYTVL